MNQGPRLDRPDERGRFGAFGGRFAPETLMPALLELEEERVEFNRTPLALGWVHTKRESVARRIDHRIRFRSCFEQRLRQDGILTQARPSQRAAVRRVVFG